jgi:hypothetical protein
MKLPLRIMRLNKDPNSDMCIELILPEGQDKKDIFITLLNYSNHYDILYES